MASSVLVVLVCGLPGAGKSTLVRRLAACRGTEAQRVTRVIEFDGLLAEQADTFSPETWKASQDRMAELATAALQEQSHTKQPEGQQFVLILDDNFHLRSMRKRFAKLAEKLRVGFGIIFIDADVGDCQKRNAARTGNARVPDEAFERMVTTFEPPQPREFVFERNVARMTLEDSTDLESVLAQLQRSGKERLDEQAKAAEEAMCQLRQRLEDQELVKRSLVHSIDMQLRQCISERMRQPTPPGAAELKRELAHKLNRTRQMMLADVRSTTYPLDMNKSKETIIAEVVEEFQRRVAPYA